jgi:predicted PurR-regulated permease PerM
VTLAMLLFFVFTPFRRFMQKFGVPQWGSATIVVVGLVALILAIVLLLLGPTADLIGSAPTFAWKIEAKLGDVTGPLQKLQALSDRIDAITGVDPNAAKAPVADSSHFLMSVVEMAPQLLTQIIFVLLLLFFMMSAGDLLYLKIVQSFPDLSTKRRAYSALRTIEASLGSYLSTITAINAGLGLAIGLAMWAWGMPVPAFFGVAAFVLNFIPYFGLAAGAAGATVVALVSLDGFATPMLVGASYVALSSIEGQFVTPTLVSRRLAMNTVVVFLAVALWAWLWSVMGMIVAVPLLVVMRVLCDHIPGLERLGNFLGGEDPAPLGPEAEQRDAQEAAEAERRSETESEPVFTPAAEPAIPAS